LRSPGTRKHIGDPPEMLQLLGIADGTHGLDRINDVERDDEDEASPGVEEEYSRLPVDLRQPPGQAQREHPPAETEQQSGHVLAPWTGCGHGSARTPSS